jgi:hypothetical protein
MCQDDQYAWGKVNAFALIPAASLLKNIPKFDIILIYSIV